MRNMRRHMVQTHDIPQQEVDTMTNKRVHNPSLYRPLLYGGQVPWVPRASDVETAAPAASSEFGDMSSSPPYALRDGDTV